jgi:hypothetical protein
MAKKIVEYKLNADGTTPIWVESGGHFENGFNFIGITVDEDEFYVPSDVAEINPSALEARIKNLQKKKDGSDLSNAEAAAQFEAWKRDNNFV